MFIDRRIKRQRAIAEGRDPSTVSIIKPDEAAVKKILRKSKTMMA